MLDRGSRSTRKALQLPKSSATKSAFKPKSAIEQQLEVVTRVAAREGIEIVARRLFVRRGASHKKRTFHVMFNYDGQRVADYWPSNATFWTAGIKTKVLGLPRALEQVRGMIRASSRRHNSFWLNPAHDPTGRGDRREHW
jgi:hypothetical protein